MSAFLTIEDVDGVAPAKGQPPQAGFIYPSLQGSVPVVPTHQVKPKNTNIAMVYRVTLPGEGPTDKSGQKKLKKKEGKEPKEEEAPVGKDVVKNTASYCMWRSKNIAGFSVRQIVGTPLFQKFQVKPLERSNGLLTPLESIIFGRTLEFKDPNDLNERQVLSFEQGNFGLFRVKFLPFSMATVRRMYVSIPNNNKVQVPIGCIEWNTPGGLRNGAHIMDCINNQGFATRTVVGSDLCNRFEIIRKGEGERGKVAGLVYAVSPVRNYTSINYQITFAEDTTNDAPWETKVLMLCALVMWIITLNEKRENATFDDDLLQACCFLIMIVVLIGFWIGVLYF